MKKIFLCIILTLLLFMPSALALNSVLEPMENVYYSLQINDYYNSSNQGYLKVGENLVYCLEPEKKYYSNQDYSLVDYVGLNDEQLYQVNLISHYGYDYYGHQNYKYYLAAQELIWRLVRPTIEMSWSTEKHGANNSYINVEKEKEEIQYLVDNHFTKPYFDGEELDINYNNIVTLEDDILRYYEVISNNESSVRIEDNKLIIQRKGLNEEEIKLKKKIKYDNKIMSLYSSNNYQKVMLGRSTNEVISTLKIKQIMGNVNISVVDSLNNSFYGRNGASLKGAKYNLYDEYDNPVETFTLNEEVYIKSLLPGGRYKIKQFETTKGYLLNDNIYEFEINKNNLNPNIVMKNQLLSSNVTFEKLYGDNKEKEEGAIFEITNGIESKEITTNNNGLAIINLEYGIYSVKQIKGIENHHFINDFEITIDNSSDLKFELMNMEIKSDLKITNIDFVDREIIKEKVDFKIFNIDKNSYVLNGENNIFKTNNGVIDIHNLSYGNYYIEQVNIPTNYLPISKTYFSIPKDDEIVIENKRDFQSIKIYVLGEEELLSDVDLEIYAKEDIIVNGNLIYKKDELIEKVTTNNGEVTSIKLPKSIYYIKEIKISNEYILDDNVYEINLMEKDKLEIQNYKKKIEVEPIIDNSRIDDIPVIKQISNDKQEYIEKLEEQYIEDIEEQYVKIPNTGVEIKETKLSVIGALIIVLMGYIIIKYAKA